MFVFIYLFTLILHQIGRKSRFGSFSCYNTTETGDVLYVALEFYRVVNFVTFLSCHLTSTFHITLFHFCLNINTEREREREKGKGENL